MGRCSPDNDLILPGSFALHLAKGFDFRNGLLHILARKRQSLKPKHCLLGHRIQCHAGLQRKKPGHSLVLREMLRERSLELSLLDVDEREFTIRRESHLRLRLLLIVVGNVFGTAFLIGAHDEPHALLQRNAAFLNGTHSIQRTKQRSLVIRSTSAIEASVLFHHLERLGYRPALAGRHHIGMGQNVQRTGQCRIEICRRHIVIIILH